MNQSTTGPSAASILTRTAQASPSSCDCDATQVLQPNFDIDATPMLEDAVVILTSAAVVSNVRLRTLRAPYYRERAMASGAIAANPRTRRLKTTTALAAGTPATFTPKGFGILTLVWDIGAGVNGGRVTIGAPALSLPTISTVVLNDTCTTAQIVLRPAGSVIANPDDADVYTTEALSGTFVVSFTGAAGAVITATFETFE